MFKRDWTTLHNHDWVYKLYVTISRINKHTLPISITKSDKNQFPIRFLQLLPHVVDVLMKNNNFFVCVNPNRFVLENIHTRTNE
jgi:hypothetical protein